VERAIDGIPLIEALRRLRIEPTLMVYVANPDRAAAIAGPLMHRYPDVRFRVAVNLETRAPADETLGGYAESERQRRLAVIERELQGGNFDGLALELEDGWSLARPPAEGGS
jgi:hypothetical protein